MSYTPGFTEPEWLFALLLIPWSIWLGARIHSLPTARKWTAITLRALILTCVVLALAQTELVRTQDQLAVYFLLDHSNSVPTGQRESAVAELDRICAEHLSGRDEAGLIVFGRESSIELKPASQWGLRSVQSVVGGDDTDIAAAIRLATAAFPQGYMRRIVVVTDGNETRGAALEEAKAARADGIAVDVLPIDTGGLQEVRIREVTAPHQAGAGEPVQIRVVVNSNVAGTGTLYLTQRSGAGAEGMREMLAPQKVTVQPGDNVFVVNQELPRAGLYEYEARIEMEGDSIAENNTGRAFTTVSGEPQVLLVESSPEEGEALAQALIDEGLQITRIPPASFPSSPARLQAYDGIVLVDVSGTQLTSGQLSLIKALVRDQGTGLVMVGGPDTFGAGGYLGTPVEEALPVDMDIKQRKVLPRGALVVVLHTCEIPDGNLWAREIALAALNVLSAQDLMGGLGYTWQSNDQWLFDLQPVGDKVALRQIITDVSQQIGDMPATDPTLRLAHQALKNADAAAKRIVLISDGDPAAPLPATMKSLMADQIPVSTVCIAPHSASDQGMLRNLAGATGGSYYFVNNASNLPQIFSKEASIVKRGLLIEEPFTPAVNHDSELLAGLEEGLPILQGYVVTTPKDNATVPLVSHEGDPILAHWRFGLGKSLAFTSDATSRWAEDWLDWGGFSRFWAQNVRWALRAVPPTNFRVETRLVDGEGRVRIDAVDETGRFVNFLAPRGLVTTPDSEPIELDLAQTGPGVYEARFPIDGSGIYLANISYEDARGRTGMIPTGLAVDYAREYEYHTTNYGWLETLAALGGGQILGPEDSPFRHDLKASATIFPIWVYLLVIAACLLPIEIFIRRVALPWRVMWAWSAARMRKVPVLRRVVAQPAPPPAPVTGVYRAAAPESAAAAPVSFGEVSAPTPEKAGGTAPEAAGQPEPVKRPPGKSEYTSRLLDAKRRVQQQWQKDEDKEDDA